MKTTKKTKEKKKVWKALTQDISVAGSAGPVISVSNEETSQEDWLKGYWRWRKIKQKLKNLTSK